MSTRPTLELLNDARSVLADVVTMEGKARIDESELAAIRILLAATEPQDDIPIERRDHFRMTPHRRPNGPVFCVDQRGNGEFDVYFEHQDKFVWSSFQLYQFAQWARQAWNKT